MTARLDRRRGLRIAVAIAAAVSLALGVFVVVGARVVRPVPTSEAVARFEAHPSFSGLATWARPLKGSRPLPGVYLYATTGGAKVDRLGINRRYPSTTARIVRLGKGCQWQEQVVLLVEHAESYDACADGGDQLDTGFGSRMVYVFVPKVTDLVCSAGGTRTAHALRSGEASAYACDDTAHHVHSDVTVTFLGTSATRVAGARVPCRRVAIRSVLSGSVNGVAERALCTEPTTGLTLSETRSISFGTSHPFLGKLTHTETATFTLLSLTPLV